jgi:hypothetical protein
MFPPNPAISLQSSNSRKGTLVAVFSEYGVFTVYSGYAPTKTVYIQWIYSPTKTVFSGYTPVTGQGLCWG